MNTEAKLVALVGLLFAAMAVPQWSQAVAWAFANPLPSLVLLVLVAVWVLSGPGSLRARLPALFGDRRTERAYLRALNERYDSFLALIAPSASRETRQRLRLDIAYIPLTLRPEAENDEAAPPPALPNVFFARQDSELDKLEPTAAEMAAGALLRLAVYGLLSFLVLRAVDAVLWPGGQFSLSVGRVLLTLLALLVAVGVVWLMRRFSLFRAVQRRWRRRRVCTADPTSAEGLILAQRRLLVKGGPGSGKTVLLSHLALLCARELLGQRDPRGRSWVRERLGWPETPFPILIPLRALHASTMQGGSLLEGYAAAMHLPAGCDGAFFKRRAERGGCLLLIDAIDELPDPTTRNQLARLVRELPQGPPDRPNRIVITTRPIGYDGALNHDFMLTTVAPLVGAQVNRFVRARYDALALLDPRLREPARRAEHLLRRLPNHPGLQRMTGNPLLLSLAVSLHYQSQSRELPNERYRLYGDACAMLIADWEQHRADELAPFLKSDQGPTPHERSALSRDQKLRLVSELAWEMYNRNTAQDDGSHAVILNPDAERILAGVLRSMLNHSESDPARLDELCRSEATRWLSNLEQSGGLLRDYGYEHEASRVFRVQFIHQEFQSYLAACAAGAAYLSTAERQQRHNQLLARRGDPRMRETLLLYAAITNADPVLERLLESIGASELLLAGDVLLEYPVALSPQLRARVIARLRRLALDSPDPSAPNALAAFARLRDADQLPSAAELLDAFRRATYKRSLLEFLGDMARDTPTNRHASPQLCEMLVALLAREQDPSIRIAAANAMARNDPRYAGPGSLPELVEIPGGRIIIGSDASKSVLESPRHERLMPTVWISRTPVTNAQFRAFVREGYTQRRFWSAEGWRWRCSGFDVENEEDILPFACSLLLTVTRGRLGWLASRVFKRSPFHAPWRATWNDPRWNGDSQPVTNISYFEAEAYCAWLTHTVRHPFRLPTGFEWEQAARGTTGWDYPWGNEWADNMCNSAETKIGRTTPVGSYPQGGNAYGVLDMAGNVQEWCNERYQPYPGAGGVDRLSIFLAAIILSPLFWLIKIFFAATFVRGGAMISDRSKVYTWRRNGDSRYDRSAGLGFRVASSIPLPSNQPQHPTSEQSGNSSPQSTSDTVVV